MTNQDLNTDDENKNKTTERLDKKTLSRIAENGLIISLVNYTAYTVSGGSAEVTLATNAATLFALGHMSQETAGGKAGVFFGSLTISATGYGVGAGVSHALGTNPDTTQAIWTTLAKPIAQTAWNRFAPEALLPKKNPVYTVAQEKADEMYYMTKVALIFGSAALLGGHALYQNYFGKTSPAAPVKKETTLNALPTELFLESAHETARGKNTITWAQAQKLVA